MFLGESRLKFALATCAVLILGVNVAQAQNIDGTVNLSALSGNQTVTGTSTINVDTNTTFSGTIALGSYTTTISGTNTNGTFSGVISGSGGITITDTGTTTFTGANTYTGTTTISYGQLAISSGGGISSVVTIGSSGTLTYTVSSTPGVITSLTFVANNGTIGSIINNSSSPLTLPSTINISNGGSWTKQPVGTSWVLVRGAGGYTGGSTLVVDPSLTSGGTVTYGLNTATPNELKLVILSETGGSSTSPVNQVDSVGQVMTMTSSAVDTHEFTLLYNEPGAAAGSEGKSSWVWGQMLGGGALRSTTGDEVGTRAQAMGFVVGYDWQQASDLVLGIATSYVRSYSWGLGENSGSLTKANTYQVMGYGVQRYGQAFVQGQALVGVDTFDQRRIIVGADEYASAQYTGSHVSTKVGGGYDLPMEDGLVLTPLASLRFTRIMNGAYSENGAGTSDLSVYSNGTNSLTQDIGARVAFKVKTEYGILSPSVRLAWVHEYIQGDTTASGTSDGTAFYTTAERPAADGVRLNLGMALESSDDMTLSAEYEGELHSDYQSHTGIVKATFGF